LYATNLDSTLCPVMLLLIILWNFRFSWQRVWRWLSSVMLCHVVW
jgi:hypothetical protein